MLSHPLPIVALVGHYPTNKLVGRSLLLGRNHTFDPGMLSGITHSFPWLFRTLGHITTRYSPFRRCPASKASFRNLLARLACLIHAANVHSEPESNPSIGYMHQLLTDGSGEAKEPFEVLEVLSFAEATNKTNMILCWLSRSRLQRTTSLSLIKRSLTKLSKSVSLFSRFVSGWQGAS